MLPNTMIVLALLLIPPDTGADYAVYATPHNMGVIKRTAVAWEIMDPRELPHTMVKPEDFNFDLRLLQRRYQSLKGAPPASDADRLPDRSKINDMLAFNRQYHVYLLAARRLNTVDEQWYAAAIEETDELYAVWDAARDATCGYYYVSIIREALQKLRGKLGRRAYDALELPPYVPVWRFRSID